MVEKIQSILNNSINIKQGILHDNGLLRTIQETVEVIISCFRNEGKVLFCGNGGSAADAQHLAAEFSGRFYYERDPLFAEALHVNTSYLTAVGNDRHFDEIYARIIKAKGKEGDILVAISTSGDSENILQAIKVAKNQGMTCIAMTGKSGGRIKSLADYLLNIPSKDTPRIQECHITIGHIICQLVEEALFPQ